MLTPTLTIALVAHILISLIGITFSTAVWVGLLMADPKVKFLKTYSLSAFLSYILSWILGGYYYVVYYGANVKPLLKAGSYPWTHSVIMETKEHIFLIIPFLALVLTVVIWLMGDKAKEDKLKDNLTYLAGLISVLGIAIALMGVIISGGVNQ